MCSYICTYYLCIYNLEVPSFAIKNESNIIQKIGLLESISCDEHVYIQTYIY